MLAETLLVPSLNKNPEDKKSKCSQLPGFIIKNPKLLSYGKTKVTFCFHFSVEYSHRLARNGILI